MQSIDDWAHLLPLHAHAARAMSYWSMNEARVCMKSDNVCALQCLQDDGNLTKRGLSNVAHLSGGSVSLRVSARSGSSSG